MTWLRILKDRIRGVRHRDAVAGEIHDELKYHHERLSDRLTGEGWRRDDAVAEARRRIGNLPLSQDIGYDVKGGGWMETLLQDLKYGARRLRGQPGFTIVALLTLSLGIGATTAIFSVANGLLLKPLPYPHADRLAMVWMDNARIGLREDWLSYPDYNDYRTQNRTFEDIAIFNNSARTLTADGTDPERIQGAHCTPNLFTVLGVNAAAGRTFTEAENVPAASNVIVISHGLWLRRFGGKTDALESTIQLSGRAMRVIGVMPEGFAFPSKDTEFWVPTAPSEQNKTSRSFWLQAIGRIKPGVPIEQAQSDLSRINADIKKRVPQYDGYGVNVADYMKELVGRVRTAVLVLLGAVVCVLLIACANVANLLLARATTREREMALRAAIGAGRRRLVRQLITESVLLSCLGGVAGIALAWFGLKGLLAAAPADLPRVADMAMNPTVLAFSAGLSILTGLFFGTLPALQMAAADLNKALREGGRSGTGVGRSIRRGLVVLEVAMAVVLLVGAGLMIRSFQRINTVDMGFKTDRVMTARVTLYGQRYAQGPARSDFFKQVLERTRATPGIEDAGAVDTIMLTATPNSAQFSIEGRGDFAPEQRLEIPIDSVTPEYFTTMRIPLLKGRLFDDRDSATSAPTVVINNTFARNYWPNEDPIGHRIKYGLTADQGAWITIVGVVGDTRRTGFDAPVRPETYLPASQAGPVSMLVAIRGAQTTEQGLAALRTAVRAVDSTIPISQSKPLADVVGGLAAQRRLNTLLLTIFAIVAAILAAVGVYGVMAYSVSERTKEIGVRMALGASSRGILRLVLLEGVALAFIGIAIGVGGALALGRLMTSLLYETAPTDPATLVSIAGIAALTAMIASLVPAVRAVRLSATVALRAE